MKIKKTYYDLLVANLVMDAYIKKNPENRLFAAIKIFSKELKIVIEKYNDELDSLQISNCAVDPVTHVILRDSNGNRQFTVQGELNLKKQGKELLFTEVEVSSKIFDNIEDLIVKLSDEEKKAFSGLIIPEQIC